MVQLLIVSGGFDVVFYWILVFKDRSFVRFLRGRGSLESFVREGEGRDDHFLVIFY